MSNGGAQRLWFGPFFEDGDDMYRGIKVLVTEVGTTNAKTYWTDEAKTTAVNSGVLTDADGDGIATAFFDGDYRFRVTTSADAALDNPIDWDSTKVTSDTATMWEGNFGTSFPSATSANKWQSFLKHNATDTFAEIGVNNGSAFTVIASTFTGTLNEIISAVGATDTTVVVNDSQTLTANLTTPTNVSLIVELGGLIIKDSTYTLTINGDFQAGVYQTFSGFASGDVSFGTSSVGEVRPEWWDVDATADDVEINLAHDSLTRGTVLLVHGKTYNTTGTITIDSDRVNLEGGGQQSTIIDFDPPSELPAIHLHDSSSASAPTTTIVQNSLKGFAIVASNDATTKKIGIRLTDTEETILEDIAIGTFSSSGNDSIGIQYRGRQTLSTKNLTINTDLPISIEDNPGTTAAGIDIDHAHFQDLFLTANANPCVLIADGVNLTNVTFDGYQPWVIGTYGLFWSDTSTTGTSLNLSISGLRTEQGTDANAYSILISHNTQLQGLNVSDCKFDSTRRGVYLRKVLFASFNNTLYGGTLEAFNADGTVDSLSFNNTLWQTGGSETMTGLRQITAWYQKDAANPIPSFALYEPDVDSTAPVGIKINANSLYTRYAGALADAGTIVLEKATDVSMIDIVSDTGAGGKVVYDHSNTITRKITGTAGLTITKDNATTINVYYNAGSSQVLVQNLTGGAVDLIVTVMGR